MKIKLPILILLFLPVNVFCVDYYYYKGSRIELIAREDKVALTLNSDSHSENFVKSKLSLFISKGDEIKKALPDVYLINFSSKKTFTEMDNLISKLTDEQDMVKLATKVYYGSSRNVTQIPSDKFIVRLKNSSDADMLNAMCADNGCSIISMIRDYQTYLIESNFLVSKNALELSEIYFSTGIFEYAEPDFIYPEACLLHSHPNDLFYPLQWALNNTGQLIQTGSIFLAQGDLPVTNGIPDADMDVPEAWDYTTGSPSIKIGIIDTGIDSLHLDILGNHLLAGYNAFQNVNSSATDLIDHGTSVAGIISANRNNLIGISGIAPGCKVMSISLYDVNGTTTSSVIARAFDSARAKGIDVINNSWGGITQASIITDAINYAAVQGRNGLGCVILFSSGNDGRNPPEYPSTLPNVLCVGASTYHDQKKAPGTGNHFFWGSNYGENATGDLDVTAPTNCYTLSAGGLFNENFWGTSASCPNVAGIAALVLSVNSSLSRMQVYQNISRGCEKIDNVQYVNTKIYGRWNSYYGYGRVNAYNSVRLAAGMDVTAPTINHLNVSSHSSTYPTIVKAEIIDEDGETVPTSGSNAPKIFYKLKKGASGNWSGFDSANASLISGNEFTFKIPSLGWETEVLYYIRAWDIHGNLETFPNHSPDPFWLCYFAVGSITFESNKIPPFRGADYGPTVSPAVNFYNNFKILSTKVKLYMRHTYLDDEVIQIYSPNIDANNNRKCLFSSNGGSMDNISGATSSDSSNSFWKDGIPPYTNAHYKPEFTLRGLNGTGAGGAWRILHFDRGITDFGYFDSVRVTLYKTSGVYSSSVRHNVPGDSILLFDSVTYPNVYEKNFYLKNSGTSNLALSNFSITGPNAAKFSLVNSPASTIAPSDSAQFRIRYAASLSNAISQDAILNIVTNDPSKSNFKVSLQTNDSLLFTKNLQLTLFIQGLFNPVNNTTVQDTVKVSLRSISSPYQLIDYDKSYCSSSGLGSFDFSNAQNNTSYYLAVEHRNAIETWSATGQSFTASSMSYNFTTAASKAFGNNLIRKGSKYCIYSGDVDQRDAVDVEDLVLVYNSSINYVSGYLPTDLTGDNFTDASDLVITHNNSLNYVFSITP